MEVARLMFNQLIGELGLTFRCQFLGTTKVTNSLPQVEAFLKDMARTAGLKAGGQMPDYELCISRTRVWTRLRIFRIPEHVCYICQISFTTQDPDDKTVFGYVCRPINPFESNNELYAFKSEEAEVIIKTLRKYIGPTTNIMTKATGSLDAQDELRECQQQLRDVTRQMTIVRGQLQEKDDETANLQNQATALRQRLEEKDQEIIELETTLSIAQDELCEHQRQQSPEWVISRDHIQLTSKFLGRGGWGSVVEGKYCGCSVAVKQIHELILSPHNRKLFEREMDIASRCRHPCLLQFIGATNDEGNPLFVTELMETSLRTLLEERALSEAEMSFISLDVARALNYLHQKQPSPIIHRDVSSANVLLWRQGEHWRGKVSDYGTANFMQQTMTVAPGAMIYSAPEALTKNQTVKVDVYSFGVLLCEMCIRELPDPMRRDRQVAMVKNKLNRALIRGCLQSEPEARPSIQEIIEELEEPV